MNRKFLKMSMGVMLTGVLLTSCDKNNDPEPNEEEVITTMILRFTPTGGGPVLEYEFNDPDGPGGAAPTQEEIVLAPAATYAVAVQLLNRTETPAEDITTEVLAEADAHRFYYEPTPGSNITVSGLSNDPNGVPVGINSTWTTAAAGTGSVRVTLRHYPGTPPGKETTDPVNSPKSGTDIEVNFISRVQ